MSTFIIFADQVFLDPTFFGIFVCSPLWLMFVLYDDDDDDDDDEWTIVQSLRIHMYICYKKISCNKGVM